MDLTPAQLEALQFVGFDSGALGTCPPVGSDFAGYRLLREIGSGSGGVVYEARRLDHGPRVALKLSPLDPVDIGTRARRQREAELLSSLTHPNLVRVLDFGEQDDFHWIAMDFIHGWSIAEVLAGRAEGMPRFCDDNWFPFAVQVLRQVAGALAAAHEQGIVHRDVKPENVLVDRSGRAFLVDFGLAHPEQQDDAFLQSSFCGTPLYASPEQARQEMLTCASDVFSFGTVAFETLVGKPAFPGQTTEETLHAVRFEDPPWPETEVVPAGLKAIIDKCLEKEIEDSFPNAEELLHAWNEWQAGFPSAPG